MKHMARILRDILLTVSIMLLLGLVVVRLDGSQQEALSGQARVIDGDTLALDGKRIRLVGIDAPELRQVCRREAGGWPCGREARSHLTSLIGKATTTCAVGGSDRYGRLLAVCSSGGRDLNAAMVGVGYAVAFGDYDNEEEDAREKRLGIWSGSFDPPRTWRQTHGEMDETPHIPDGWLDTGVTQFEKWMKVSLSRLWND
jgi:endonuclease YncB( thermonuclease family)